MEAAWGAGGGIAPVSPALPLEQPKPDTHMRSQGAAGVGGAEPRTGPPRSLGQAVRLESPGWWAQTTPNSAEAGSAQHPSLSPTSQQK